MKRLLISLILLATVAIAAVPDSTSAHTYTTSYYSCWKFYPGIWYLQQTTTRYADNWWGGGHYVVWSQTVNLGSRCYIS